MYIIGLTPTAACDPHAACSINMDVLVLVLDLLKPHSNRISSPESPRL
jgi:hypothetical protein